MMQYWRDFDALEAFAHDGDQPHPQAWRQLVKQTATDTTFGYWHETYIADSSTTETIYGSMKPFGLSAAVGHRTIDGATETARTRLAEITG